MEKENRIKTRSLVLTTIYDNYKFNPNLKTGWGFSCLIKDRKNILFDTGGDSDTLLYNFKQLNINPKMIDIVMLSHNHSDHIGGLSGFLKVNENKARVIKPDEFSEPAQISSGIYSIGYLSTSFIKEQSLVISTPKGLIIITGCSHPGIINIIKRAKNINKKVYLVIGGFHLLKASYSELKDIIKNFRKLGVKKVAPSHCSGDICRELFKEEYKDNFIANGVGKIIKIL